MPSRPHDVDDVAEDFVGDQHLPHCLAAGRQFGDPRNGFHRGQVAGVEAAGVAVQDRDLLIARRQGHIELQQEPVQLGLGQLVGALVLDRVLCRGDDERVRQRPRLALDADLALLHGLQEGGLRFGWSAVDLVGQQQVGEHRSGVELEFGCAGVIYERAGDVARHQVWSELHSLEVELQRCRKRPHQQRLRDAGNALQQHVAAAQQCDHQAADDCLLPDDRLGDLTAQGQQGISCGVRCRRRCGSGALRCWLSHD